MNNNQILPNKGNLYEMEEETYHRNTINRSDSISYTTKFEDACCWG